MKFTIIESTYNKQGTEKAFACSDQYSNTYWIPRSQVKVIEKIEPETEYDMPRLVIDVPDWIIRRNNIPVFTITEMDLVR